LLLEEATEATAEVDKESAAGSMTRACRSAGETLAGMALTLRREVFGPEGRDDMGRQE
jgi:hypothetical protein